MEHNDRENFGKPELHENDFDEDNKPERFCAICGEILPTPYIAATYEITNHDWVNKCQGYLVCDVCYHCHMKIMENINGGIESAYEKIGRKYIEK